MILPFSTEINGNNTYFVEKILTGLRDQKTPGIEDFIAQAYDGFLPKYEINRYVLGLCKPKLHSMRVDENSRWSAGNKVGFIINNRTKKMLRFAPTMPCVSTQKIEIIYKPDTNYYRVHIDNKWFGVYKKNSVWDYNRDIELLAYNDGFPSVADFFTYFKDGFEGKIIHWTDLKY